MRTMRFTSILLFVLLLAACEQPQSSEPLVFSEIMNSNIVGKHKKWTSEDGVHHQFYQISDRGRGDSIVVTYKTNAKGFMTELSITGHDYYKVPVEETFSVKNGVASWKNASEDEEMTIDKDAFYVSLKGSGGNVLKALTLNNNTIDLLPSGQLELSILKEHIVTVDGNEKKLFLYATKGLGLTPSYGWMDEDKNEFATLGSWYSSIREGYEDLREALYEIQKTEEKKFFSDMIEAYVETPESILFTNVTLFNAESASFTPGSNVLIKNGMVEAVSQQDIEVTDDTEIIEGNGATLLPGLIDMHVHLSSNLSALQHIVNGVTGARDLGNSFDVLDFKKDIDKGRVIGPTMEGLAGLIDGKGEYAGPTPMLAGSLKEALSWVDTMAVKGYKQVKLYSSISPEWVPEIAKHAKAHGMRVSGHIPAFMTATEAVKNGYDEIQHMNMIFLNFFGDTIDTRSPMRFSVPAKHAANFDFEGEALQEFIELLKTNKVTIDPTLAIFERLFTGRPGIVSPAFEPIMKRLPLVWQRYIKAGGGSIPVPEGYDNTYKESFNAFMAMTKKLYDSGVPIVAGTDDWAGFSMHRELELYVKAGIPANEVLKIATYGAAKVLGKENEIGSITKGKRANIVLIDGDPGTRISDTRNVVLVVKDGSIYDIPGLLAAISIKNYDYSGE